jgi:hypothetical protein
MRARAAAAASFSVFLLLPVSAACSKPAAPATAAASATPAAPPVESVADVVRAAATSDAPLHTLNGAAQRRGEAADLGSALIDPSPAVRRAAAYVAALWADDAADIATLTPLLTDADAAVRAMVAGSLAGLGHVEARHTLESLRASGAAMPWSDPPVTVGAFASSALTAIDAAGIRR